MSRPPRPDGQVVVDASVWVSVLVDGEVNDTASRAWLHGHLTAGGMIASPTLLLAELSGALSRRWGNPILAEQSVARWRIGPSLIWIQMSGSLIDHAARLAASRRLRGADAIYVAVADRLGVPLVTWDREQLERAAGVARTP